MTSITIKAYLYNSWEQDPVEIRRFTVEQDVVASYEYLVGKLRTVFSKLKEAVFDIYWEGKFITWHLYNYLLAIFAIDEESDRISISTDEELFLAISGLQSTVLKLYLRKNTSAAGESGQKPTPSKPVHPNVICDGCQQGIVGTRYKCLSCADYDLCSGINTSCIMNTSVNHC